MEALAAEEKELLAPVRAQFRKLVREAFEEFYPKLTDDQIREALEFHTSFNDLEIRIIQSFYKTISYPLTVEALELHPGSTWRVRDPVKKLLQVLPEGSPLHVALTMAYKEHNMRRKSDA